MEKPEDVFWRLLLEAFFCVEGEIEEQKRSQLSAAQYFGVV